MRQAFDHPYDHVNKREKMKNKMWQYAASFEIIQARDLGNLPRSKNTEIIDTLFGYRQ